MSTEKKGCGCLAKGCAVMVVLFLGFLFFCGWTYHRAVAWMQPHTETKSMAVEADPSTKEEYDALVKKMQAYQSAVAGKTIELTAHDLNVLLAFSPDWKPVREKLHVATDKDEISVTGSIPLTALLGLSDRHANGTLRFKLWMEDTVLHLDITNIQMKGSDLTPAEVTSFSNLAAGYLANTLLGDPVLKQLFVETNTLKTKDGVLVFTHK